jgi:hypothetical protein
MCNATKFNHRVKGVTQRCHPLYYWTFFVSPSANIDPHSAPSGKALTPSLKSDVKFAVEYVNKNKPFFENVQ